MLKPNDCQNMNDIREQIDSIDYEIISLISKRAGYVNKAAQFKTDEASVKAPNRVKSMLEKRKQWAQEKEISPVFIEKMYADMVSYFINKEMHEWKNEQGSICQDV